jgi:hypothetical protein
MIPLDLRAIARALGGTGGQALAPGLRVIDEATGKPQYTSLTECEGCEARGIFSEAILARFAGALPRRNRGDGDMTVSHTPLEVRRQLLGAGFSPLPLNGKAPVIEAWQKRYDTTDHEIELWSRTLPAAQNTGILTRLTPTLDIDIRDPDAAAAIERLVRDRFEDKGRILARFGNAPKRCIPFRTLTPFPKTAVNFVVPDGAPDERLELLCDGQQVVVDGIHPDTHQPYTWFDTAPGEVRHEELPLINAEEAQALLDGAARLLVEGFGYRLKPAKAQRGNGGKTHSHLWRSKDHDFPCTPTGVEQLADNDGRIYAWVRTPGGTDHIVPKDELVPAPGGNGAGVGEGQADWGITPDVLMDHDKCTALAMRLLMSDMNPGAAVNLLRTIVEGLTNVDEDRRQRRLKEIPGMVSSAGAKLLEPPLPNQPGVTLGDFRAYMLQHNYIFAPTGELWPGASVNSRIPPICVGTDSNGKLLTIPASAWLDRNKPVEQITWSPGEPMLIRERLITGGGWIDRPGATAFNLYRGPTLALGDLNRAGPWLDHVRHVYPNDADQIIFWLAHRVQRPQEKINHALVLGGLQGIGKDTLLEPVKRAVGPWNVSEVSPQQLLGRFNGFLKSVILRVSEARDLGEVNRYSFYDHLKAMTAAPPDVLRVDEKHLREYCVPNVCGVVITTNHKTDGIFLPADDRRHYVAWSELTKDNFEADYWTKLYRWYDEGGDSHVAAYLASLDLAGFDPKAPPRKTQAFWDIVDASRAPEDAELADVLDKLKNPPALTLADAQNAADSGEGGFGEWLLDRKNRRQIPYRFEQCGYTPVRNGAAPTDGLWKIKGKRQAVYARAALSSRDQLAAAGELAAGKRWDGTQWDGTQWRR